MAGMRSFLAKAAMRAMIASALTLSAGAALAAKDRVVIDLVGEPNSLDPHVQWNPDSYYVYRNIFDNLLSRDDKGDIIPQIAKSWKYLSDTRIQFILRDDAVFHDGKKLTADDVAYSVKRITDPKFASPQLGQFDKITDAVANDATTVTLTTNGAYPALLADLGGSGAYEALTSLFKSDPQKHAALEHARLAFLNLPPSVEIGSNEMAVSPLRSADGHTRLMVNSHQPYTGPVAWYEAQVQSEEGWDRIGGVFPGSPVILHGAGPDNGWAFTVNEPDVAGLYTFLKSLPAPARGG